MVGTRRIWWWTGVHWAAIELPDLKKAAKKGFRGCIQAAVVRRDALGRRRVSESCAMGMNTKGDGLRRDGRSTKPNSLFMDVLSAAV